MLLLSHTKALIQAAQQLQVLTTVEMKCLKFAMPLLTSRRTLIRVREINSFLIQSLSSQTQTVLKAMEVPT